MQIAYVDETGTDGNSPALVMVGVLAHVTRLARTNVEFATAFSGLCDVASSALTELKSSDLYRGRGSWKNVAGEERLVQVADLYAFIFRRYAELLDYHAEQSYEGEGARITEWVELLAPRLLGRAHRWPAKPSCDAARWYVDLAPPSLRTLK